MSIMSIMSGMSGMGRMSGGHLIFTGGERRGTVHNDLLHPIVSGLTMCTPYIPVPDHYTHSVQEGKKRCLYGKALWMALLMICALKGPLLAQNEGQDQARTTARAPQRIVSTNLCADQIVLALADPRQIRALSPFARDPHQSFLAAQAMDFPQSHGTIEDLVEKNADMVLVGPYDQSVHSEAFHRYGWSVVSVSAWAGLEHGEAELRRLGEVFGHPERAEVMIADMRAARTEARALAAQHKGEPVRIALIQRRGYTPRDGLLLMALADLGIEPPLWPEQRRNPFFVSIEDLLVARPALLAMMDNADAGDTESTAKSQKHPDQGQAFLDHPALQALWPSNGRIRIPELLTACDGPSTAPMIRMLSSALRPWIGPTP
jgi:iron complex transport system substrate-binding protein